MLASDSSFRIITEFNWNKKLAFESALSVLLVYLHFNRETLKS